MTRIALPSVVMDIPPGWSDRSQLIIVSDVGDEFRANIVVVDESRAGRTLRAFVALHLETLRKTFDGFTVLFDGPAEFGPYAGHLRDYEFVADDKAYRQRQFHTIVDDMVYTFTYSNSAAAFDSGKVTLEESVANARILPQQPAIGISGDSYG